MMLRDGPAGDVLAEFIRRFDAQVENVDQGADDWGYAHRFIGKSRTWSNHASGTAADLNATRHPQGRRGTFSTAQVAAIRKIIAELGSVIRWGGDYSGSSVDEMHFEIIGTPDRVAVVAQALRDHGHPPAPPAPPKTLWPTLRLGERGPVVSKLQRHLNTVYPAYSKLQVDGVFGRKTEAVVREFQTRARIPVDGVVGPRTWRALGF